MEKIAILADSGCQIPVGSRENEGIFIAPLTITMEGKSYLDDIEIHSIDVFERMEKDDIMVMTSQPSTGSLQEAVQKIKDQGYSHVIGLPIATGLSSTMNGMKLACDMLEMPVTLVDTKGTASNQKYLVEVAAKLAHEGKSPEEIKDILEKLVEDSATIIMVPNLEHLKKGGRITPAVAALAGLLKIVPIMKLNYSLGGKIDSFGKVRTAKKANLKIIDHMVNECKVNNKNYVFAIEHVLSEDLALEMKQKLIEQIVENTKGNKEKKMIQRVDTIETVVDVFNIAMDIQELYLKQGPFKQLSMSEMHVLEAVDKESSPSMSAVANHLNVTLGTLTTAVKKIVEKGFLIKEKSTQDQRIYYLRLTNQGKEALKVHEQFHHELDSIYRNRIPDERVEWVFSTLSDIYKDLVVYRNELLRRKDQNK